MVNTNFYEYIMMKFQSNFIFKILNYWLLTPFQTPLTVVCFRLSA